MVTPAIVPILGDRAMNYAIVFAAIIDWGDRPDGYADGRMTVGIAYVDGRRYEVTRYGCYACDRNASAIDTWHNHAPGWAHEYAARIHKMGRR